MGLAAALGPGGSASTLEIAVTLAVVGGTCLLSGTFGMVGGMALIGVMVVMFDLTTAMIAGTAVLISTNLWRLVAWVRDVRWDMAATNLIGGLLAFATLKLAGYDPSKAVVLLAIGAPPLLMNLLPRRHWPSIDTRHGQLLCGYLVGLTQIMGAASAALADIFYQRSSLTRTEVVALRSACIVPLQFLRGAFFVLLGSQGTGTIEIALPVWVVVAAMIVGITATAAGGVILKRRFTDAEFRRWSWRLSTLVSMALLGQGLWMLSR